MRTQAPAPVLDLEIDWNLTGAPTAIEPDATERTPSPIVVNDSWDATLKSQPAADLARQEDTLLSTLGIESSDSMAERGAQFFATGTALATSGHEALEAYDRAFKALPSPDVALDGFRSQIAAEERRDRIVDLVDYRVDVDGRLSHKEHALGGHGVSLERNAWLQLAECAGGPNVNLGLSKRKRAERRVRARTLDGQSDRSVFGIVSADARRGYTVLDGPEVADLVAAGLKDAGQLSGSKMTIAYEPDSTRYEIRVVVQAPVDVHAFRGVGRVHQLYMRVSGGDNGATGISGALGAMRIRCLNATLTQAEGSKWHRVHRGDATEIRRLVSQAPQAFGEVARELQTIWLRAAAHHYLDTSGGGTLGVQEALTRLVAHEHLPTGGLTAEQAVDAYMAAWRAEDSPTSAAGIIMAVQRAAHESTWSTKWAQTEIEDAASELLYQNVYTLPEAYAS